MIESRMWDRLQVRLCEARAQLAEAIDAEQEACNRLTADVNAFDEWSSKRLALKFARAEFDMVNDACRIAMRSGGKTTEFNGIADDHFQ
jgi:hypothetical protein